MSDDGVYMQQLSQGFAPLTGGRPYEYRSGLEGLSFLQNMGPMGSLAQMVAGPFLNQFAGQHGMTPFGLGHDQSILDVIRNRQMNQTQHAAMKVGANLDRENYQRTFRGIANLTGTPWGVEQRKAAGHLSDLTAAASPMLAEMMPDLLDEMGGRRGSATLMAKRMALGGRYRIDPVTGSSQLSEESSKGLFSQVYKELYGKDDISGMRGITAGQAGSMFDELQRRGMVRGSDRGPRAEAVEVIRQLEQTSPRTLQKAAANQGVVMPGDISKLSAEDVDKLRLDPAVADRMRSVDAGRISRSLKDYSAAVSAMREVFGDMGKPNAPMSELINGLQALTQGAAGKIDPQRLNMMVRTTQDLAKQTGMSIDSVLAMQQHSASKLQDYGVSTLHAPQTTQAGIAYMGAYRNSGAAGLSAWGRFNEQELTQYDLNQRAGAVASAQANAMGGLMRIRESVGGFESGSEAEAIAQANIAGQATYIDPATGQAKSTVMNTQQLSKVLTGAKTSTGESIGMSEASVMQTLRDRFANEEMITKYDLGTAARVQQIGQKNRRMGQFMQASLTGELQSNIVGMDKAQAAETAGASSQRIMERFASEITPAEWADRGQRLQKASQIMREELELSPMGDQIREKGLSDAQWQRMAESALGSTETTMRRSELASMGSIQNWHTDAQLNIHQQGTQRLTTSQINSRMRDALSPLATGTPLRNLVESLQNAKPQTGIGEVIAQTLGFVPTSEVQSKLEPVAAELQKQTQYFEQLRNDYDKASTPEQRVEVSGRMQSVLDAMRQGSERMAQVGDSLGIQKDAPAVSEGQLAEMDQAIQESENTFRDTAGMRGFLGSEPTEAEVAEAKGKPIKDREVARRLIQQKNERDAETVTEEEVTKYREGDSEKMTLSREAARDELIKGRRESAGNISDEAIDKLMAAGATDDVMARDYAAALREISLTPTEDEVKAIEKTGLTRTAALDLAAARLRKQRFGISDDEVKAAQVGGVSEADAITAAIDKRGEQQYTVNDAQLAAFLKDPGGAAYKDRPVEEQKQAYFAAQQVEQTRKMTEFAKSDDGKIAREKYERSMSAMNDVVTQVATDDAATFKLGPEFRQKYELFQNAQLELQQDAQAYGIGDTIEEKLFSLRSGNINVTWDTSTEEGRRRKEAILERAERNVNATTGAAKWVAEGMRKTGRDWGPDDKVAKTMLGLEGVKDEDLTEDQRLQLKNMQGGLGALRKLDDSDLAKVDELTRGREQFRKQAQALGVTPEDAVAVLEGRKESYAGAGVKMEALTDEQTAVVTKAKDEQRPLYDLIQSKEQEAQKLEDEINAGGSEIKPEEMAKKKMALAVLRHEIPAARIELNKRLGTDMQDLAESRGVSAIDMAFGGAGYLTDERKDKLKEELTTARQFETGVQAIEPTLQKIGMSPKELARSLKAQEQLSPITEEAKQQMTEVSGELGKDDAKVKAIDVEIVDIREKLADSSTGAAEREDLQTKLAAKHAEKAEAVKDVRTSLGEAVAAAPGVIPQAFERVLTDKSLGGAERSAIEKAQGHYGGMMKAAREQDLKIRELDRQIEVAKTEDNPQRLAELQEQKKTAEEYRSFQTERMQSFVTEAYGHAPEQMTSAVRESLTSAQRFTPEQQKTVEEAQREFTDAMKTGDRKSAQAALAKVGTLARDRGLASSDLMFMEGSPARAELPPALQGDVRVAEAAQKSLEVAAKQFGVSYESLTREGGILETGGSKDVPVLTEEQDKQLKKVQSGYQQGRRALTQVDKEIASIKTELETKPGNDKRKEALEKKLARLEEKKVQSQGLVDKALEDVKPIAGDLDAQEMLEGKGYMTKGRQEALASILQKNKKIEEQLEAKGVAVAEALTAGSIAQAQKSTAISVRSLEQESTGSLVGRWQEAFGIRGEAGTVSGKEMEGQLGTREGRRTLQTLLMGRESMRSTVQDAAAALENKGDVKGARRMKEHGEEEMAKEYQAVHSLEKKGDFKKAEKARSDFYTKFGLDTEVRQQEVTGRLDMLQKHGLLSIDAKDGDKAQLLQKRTLETVHGLGAQPSMKDGRAATSQSTISGTLTLVGFNKGRVDGQVAT